MNHVKLDPVRERAYHTIVVNFIQKYQTVKDRLELRRDLLQMSVERAVKFAGWFK